jgi:NAD(P)-dependent dehydrogenase (short-subunit alcohol dehydrogenase family)
MNRFKGKVVAITGAARGIGLATAKKFSAEGANLAFIDMDHASASAAAEVVKSEFGVKTYVSKANIAEMSDVRRSKDEIVKALGTPDVFVNCAAITADKLFLESNTQDWERILSINLVGALNCLHTFLPDMVDRKSGRVIFLASDSARLGQARLSYYAASKAGVIALVKSVAQEVGRSGVTLNIVSPGATNTEMRIAREASLLEQMGAEKYDRRQKTVLKMYPLGRVGIPDDIASSVLFLASDEASWITGQVLSVNGGFCMI